MTITVRVGNICNKRPLQGRVYTFDNPIIFFNFSTTSFNPLTFSILSANRLIAWATADSPRPKRLPISFILAPF
jgi:hypothetical protein